MALPEVIIYSKPSCCLCDRALKQLANLQEQYGFVMREVSIFEDSEAYNKFREEIPVVFINGIKAFKYRVNEKAFVRMIKSGDIRQETEETSGN